MGPQHRAVSWVIGSLPGLCSPSAPWTQSLLQTPSRSSRFGLVAAVACNADTDFLLFHPSKPYAIRTDMDCMDAALMRIEMSMPGPPAIAVAKGLTGAVQSPPNLPINLLRQRLPQAVRS